MATSMIKRHRPLNLRDARILQAIALVFEGRLSQMKVAENVQVSARTLARWIDHPDFQAKLDEMREHLIESLTAQGIPYVRKEQRIIGLAQMAESARLEYEERPRLQEVRQIGRDPESGEMLTMSNEHFNRDAHQAFRDALDDIAKELGHRRPQPDRENGSSIRITIETDGNTPIGALISNGPSSTIQAAPGIELVTDADDHRAAK